MHSDILLLRQSVIRKAKVERYSSYLSSSITLPSYVCRRPRAEEDELLKEALLGQDVEAQKQKRSRSWLSLLGSAVVYVWPSKPLTCNYQD